MAQPGVERSIVVAVLAALDDLGFKAPAPERNDEITVASARANQVFDRAAAVLADPVVGLSVAQRVPVGALGDIDYALVSSASLREALQRVAEFYGVVTDRIELRVVDEPRPALVFRRRDGFDVSRHWVEFSMGMFALRLRDALGPQFKLRGVTLRHTPPAAATPTATATATTTTHDAFFGAPTAFDAAEDALLLPQGSLAMPLRTAAPMLARMLESRLRERRERRSKSEDGDDVFIERVREAIEAIGLDGERIELRGIAKALAVSSRTLQRELQRRRTSLRAVIDALRRTRAQQLLDDGRDIAEIAALLGFAEPSAFFRAFRRWTGMSPAVARSTAGR